MANNINLIYKNKYKLKNQIIYCAQDVKNNLLSYSLSEIFTKFENLTPNLSRKNSIPSIRRLYGE